MEAKSLTNSCLFLCTLFLVSNLPTTCLAEEGTAHTRDSATTTTHKKYIRTACDSTSYPKDCYKALSSYASAIQSDPYKLCNVALAVILGVARNTSTVITAVSKLKGLSRNEAAAVRDCAENVKDSIDELKQSLKAMANLKGPDRAFQLDNVRTWASAALTDENTCFDGLEEESAGQLVKKKIKTSLLKLLRMTSNFLALMNALGNY